ncbi:MAG: hypothetical protein JXA20_03075 [Spirochaetes bacterium]|nr:hypothetical protein [Spirochaetota bacterium]
MSQECELLEKCGFFKKYNEINSLACRGFIANYCKGPKIDQCKRKEYRNRYGVPPSDDMMPDGQMYSG